MKNEIEAMITDITATTAEAEDYTGAVSYTHLAAEHYILAGLLAAEHRRCPRQKGEQTGNGKCYHPAEQHW